MITAIQAMMEQALADKRISPINDFYVVTDRVDYQAIDQVLPLHPENQFFLDELVAAKIQGAHALEIGLGSGVLSIGAIKAGARRVTALEINPRAMIMAGFNILINGLEDRIAIVNGAEAIFRPVLGQKFDYIFSNPPFEPAPPGEYYMHSAAGQFGLDFVEKIFQEVDGYLTDAGHAQVVTGTPGNATGPSMLVELAEQYLPGQTTIVVNPVRLSEDILDEDARRLGLTTLEQLEAVRQMRQKYGITHGYLCVVHYHKGPKQVTVRPAASAYPNWDLPFDSTVVMGMKEPVV